MPVRVGCPHCRTPCLVAEQHLGVPVKCGRCGRSFTTRAEAPALPLRLDIGAASAGRVRAGNENSFLVQHLVYCNLEERHELAVLVVAGGRGIGAAAEALAPLLGTVLNGASQDAAGAAATLAAACKNRSAAAALAVIWDGRVSIGGLGDCPIYHQSGGRLTRLRGEPSKLAAGDWLVLACDGLHAHLDEAALQGEIAAASPSAVPLAQRLVQRASALGGSDNCTVVAARCY